MTPWPAYPEPIEHSNRETVERLAAVRVSALPRTRPDALVEAGATLPLDAWLGAAGAVEALVLVEAVRRGVLPPTINYEQPDPDCDLDYVPEGPREAPGLELALSNSFGFGGHNVTLAVRAWERRAACSDSAVSAEAVAPPAPSLPVPGPVS